VLVTFDLLAALQEFRKAGRGQSHQESRLMKILVFQHLDVEHPGVFRDFWDAQRFEQHVVELDEGVPIPSLEGFDLLAVMGGPMDVWQEDQHPWLIEEKAAIRKWVRELKRPYLGICLGHQLLADALGGAVGLMARPEVGLAQIDITPAGQTDPVFGGFGPSIETLQWHGAEITRIPEGAVTLASNAACPVQALRCGDRAYSFQCHVEILDSTVSDWEAIPEYKASLERTLGKEGAETLSRDVRRRLPAFRATALRLNDNFLKATRPA
jgi:GMP synthase-like glutamine amidotransferase